MKVRWGSPLLALALILGGIVGVAIGAVLLVPRLGVALESASARPTASASSQPSTGATIAVPSGIVSAAPTAEPSVDFVLGTWSTAAPMPNVATPRIADAAVVGQDSIMVFFEGDSTLPILKYDVASDTWSSVHPSGTIPFVSIGTGTVFRQAKDGFIYQFSALKVHRYDPLINSWATVITDDEEPYPYWASDAVARDDGSILLVYKETGATTCLRSFDPAALTLVLIRCEDGRYWNAGLSADGAILVFGEDGVARLDPVANSWEILSPPPADLFAAGMGVGPDGRVYAFNPGRARVAFDVISGQWFPVPPPSMDRYSPEVVSGPDGRLYLIGGTTLNLPPEMGGHLELMVDVFDPAD